jgi:hypothetical protein
VFVFSFSLLLFFGVLVVSLSLIHDTLTGGREEDDDLVSRMPRDSFLAIFFLSVMMPWGGQGRTHRKAKEKIHGVRRRGNCHTELKEEIE